MASSMEGVTIGDMLMALERSLIMEQGKKKLRSIYWRLRAQMRRQMAKYRKLRNYQQQQRFSFHYDALSYALNFDDGISSRFFIAAATSKYCIEK